MLVFYYLEIVSVRSGNYTSCSIKKLNIPKIFYKNLIELERRNRLDRIVFLDSHLKLYEGIVFYNIILPS